MKLPDLPIQLEVEVIGRKIGQKQGAVPIANKIAAKANLSANVPRQIKTHIPITQQKVIAIVEFQELAVVIFNQGYAR